MLGLRAQRRKCHTVALTGQLYGRKKDEGTDMRDAPEKIWAIDYEGERLWETECHGPSLTEYTRTDIAQAQANHAWSKVAATDTALLAFVAEAFIAQERIAKLEAALNGMVDLYVALVECGDCGHWNAEDEMPVKYARLALKKTT
jgi:hypothetical protein